MLIFRTHHKNNIDLKKYAFQNNIDFHMSKSSTIGLHLNAQIYDEKGPATSFDNIYGLIMKNNPVDYPVMYPKSDMENWMRWGGMTGTLADLAQNNPVAAATNGYSDKFWTSIIANLDFTQKLDFITQGLSFKAMVSFHNWSQTTRTRSQAYNSYYLSSYAQNPDGTYSMDVLPVYEPERRTLGTSNGTTGDRRFYAQAYLDYTRSFGDHNVNAMVLWNQDQYDSNAPSDLISSLPKRKIGYAGRISYDYAHRYMLELNAGYNGSENFAEGHRYGFFPSISAGWNLSEEKFWKPLKGVVSNLKLRGSYGLVGNDQIGSARFLYLAQVYLQGTSAYLTGYGTQTQSYSGPVYSRYQNNDITWEVGRKLNLGLDLQLFNSLNVTLDGFKEIRSDIFQQRGSIPNYLGTAGTVIYGNLAKVKNWGFDMSVDYGKQITKDFSMQFRGTFTFARNRVLEYDEAPGLRTTLSQVGKSLNTYWGYVADGLYIDDADIANNPVSTIGNITIAPGDIKYVDQPDADGNYDGKITSDDRVNMGYPTVPEIVYGEF